MPASRKIDPIHARRLFISKQHLDAAQRPPMLDIIRDITCLQLDPIRKVERPPQMILWSRMGRYDVAELEKLRWETRQLFEYWAHAASLVLTEDYPIHAANMRHVSRSTTRLMKWIEAHDLVDLRQHILTSLRENGAMGTADFESQQQTNETFSGWTNGRAINRLMDRMWTMGEVLPVERSGNQRKWGLAEDFLPGWTPRDQLSEREASERALVRAVKSLGVAKGRKDINYCFTRGRYWQVNQILKAFIAAGTLIPVKIGAWPGDWVMHVDDLPLLERIERGEWDGKTTLLSPFDPLICGRDRTEIMWDFFYRIEIYVPKDKREYGYYVLPILHGDDLIGRMDMEMDRKTDTLHVLSTYAEANAPRAATAIKKAVRDLAKFLGAKDIQYGETVPAKWASLRK